MADEHNRIGRHCSSRIVPALEQGVPEIPEQGVQIASAPKSRVDQRSTRSCAVCKLLHSVRSKYHGNVNYKQQLRLFRRFRSEPSKRVGADDSAFLALVRDDKRLTYDQAFDSELGSNGLIALWDSRAVEVISTDAVDCAFLERCITECEEGHDLCVRPEIIRTDLQFIKVIDCDSFEVIWVGLETRYLALSYVWGRCAATGSGRAWGVHSDDAITNMAQLPLTIQDAITLTRTLGVKYLWVDCLCIDQHDTQEKALMLHNMDLIYHLAAATIVALHGDDGTAGLPGVSSVARDEQPTFRMPQGILRSTLQPLQAAIAASRWATRGWTYQEARLSRRCLFFSKHQAYFSCRAQTRSEAVPGDARSSNIASFVNGMALEPKLFGRYTAMPGMLSVDTLMYSSRELSYASDGLDAFRGILRQSNCVTFYGIPICPIGAKLDPNLGFSLGLLWSRRPSWAYSRLAHSTAEGSAVYSRRSGFPTWSWTSVVGPIWPGSHGPSTQLHKFLEGSQDVELDVLSPAKYSICHAAGRFEPLNKVIDSNRLPLIPEIHPGVIVDGETVKVGIRKQTVPYAVFIEAQGEIPAAAITCDVDDAVQQLRAGSEHDALVIVEWSDFERASAHFVLLLIRWMAENTAERVGIVSDYRQKWRWDILKRIPRHRRQFEHL